MSDLTPGAPAPPPPQPPATPPPIRPRTLSQSVPADPVGWEIIAPLKATRPWVLLIAILTFLVAGILIVAAIGIMAVSAAAPKLGVPVGVISLIYVILGGIYIIPGVLLIRYASAIATIDAAPRKGLVVAQALQHQRAFWKFAGVSTLILVGVNFLGIIAAIVIPNFLAATQGGKQTRTVTNMNAIANGLEAYHRDHNGYPPGETIYAAANAISPKYAGDISQRDGWGEPFHYSGLHCGSDVCSDYVLASGGRNNELEDGLANYSFKREPTHGYDSDIVMRNGVWMMQPSAKASAAAEPLRDDAAKQAETMKRIRAIATAAEASATDYNRYSKAQSGDEVAGDLSPTYIKDFPFEDAWGHPIDYHGFGCGSGGACQQYVVASRGADGAWDAPDPLETRVARKSGGFPDSNYDGDLIYSNGSWVSAPESSMRPVR